MKFKAKFFLFASLALVGVSHLKAAEEPALAQESSGMIDSDSAILENARRALDSGMPALALIMTERAPHAQEYEDELRLIRIDSLIAEGLYESAKRELAHFENDKSADMNLRRAILSIRMKDGAAGELLSSVSPGDLQANLLPWFYISSGIIDFDNANFKNAALNFERAKSLSNVPSIQTEADILLSLCKVSEDLGVDGLKPLADELGVKSAVFMGMPAGAQYVKQYAIVLNKLGLKKEALEAIETHLQTPLMEDSDRDELRLIGAYIDSSVDRQKTALLEILKSTRSPEITDQAVFLLRHAYDQDSPEYFESLKGVLASSSELVRDRILLELAYLSLRKNDYANVDFYANKLIADYPVSLYAADVYRLLAFSAFSSNANKKADYRLAANHMMKVASLDKSPETSAIARFIAADCYFLDGDFDTASAMYVSLMNSNLDARWKSGAFGRALESFIKLGRMDDAVGLADSAYAKPEISVDDIWRAEWALANAYRDADETANSSARIDRLLAGPVSASADPGLRARLLWLQARIAENAGDFERAYSLSENLIVDVTTRRIDLPKALSDIIVSNTMLMRARLLSSLGRLDGNDGAFAAYQTLRDAYRDTDAAQLSYVYEARDFASRGAFAQAQQHCKTLADNFPNSKYADTALLEAAMYSEQLGLDSDFEDAKRLLDRLVKNYPDSPQVFYAKLGYAQILRLEGDYANAAAIYRNMLEDFPNHPRITAAQINFGECLLAIPGQDSDAAAVFEKIYSAPGTPKEADAEVAYKWGFALDRAGRKSEAARIWWICANEILGEGGAPISREVTPKERDWLARTLFSLADSLELSGEKRSAISAYALILKHDLPGGRRARQKLSRTKE